MHGQRIGEFERVHGVVAEFAGPESILVAELPGELDLQFPRQSLELLGLVLPDDDPQVAVSDIGLLVAFRVYVAAPLVNRIDHLVAVQDALRAKRPRYGTVPAFHLGKLPPAGSESLLDCPI